MKTEEQERQQIPMAIEPFAVSVPFQNELQEIFWRVALGLNAVEYTTEKDLELPSAFSFKPAANVPAIHERSKRDFKNWIIRNGLRDCAEALQAHFEVTFAQCLLMKYAGNRGKVASEIYEGEYVKKRQNFHKHDMHEKLKVLEREFAIVFRDNTLRCFRSLNRVRNCLSHRGGYVQKIDCNVGDVLKVEWMTLVPVRKDGSEIEFGKPLNCTEVWARKDIRARTFEKGSYLDFSSRDFAEFLMNFFFLAQETKDYVVQYAQSTGLVSSD